MGDAIYTICTKVQNNNLKKSFFVWIVNELRQGLVEERRMAQATYTNPRLAPVEDYMFAYQPPIPGYTPYFSGNFI